jgi:hypothetical protein
VVVYEGGRGGSRSWGWRRLLWFGPLQFAHALFEAVDPLQQLLNQLSLIRRLGRLRQ